MYGTVTGYTSEEQRIWTLMESVPDPEVPVLSVNDLGIIRDIHALVPGKKIEITVTPTYSGCPAMDMISMQIRMILLQQGYEEVIIRKVLSPAWTTDWMSQKGKDKLQAYGIVPPGKRKENNPLFSEPEKLQCPLCQSANTHMISEFGSTACKSLYQCKDCGEPFDYFKCH